MFSLQAEEMVQLMLAELGADDAQAAGIVSGAAAHLMFFGHIVKMEPLAALGRNNALGAQDHTVLAAVQGSQDPLDFALSEHLDRLHAPAGEHLVGVVMVMIVVMAAAGAVLVMFVMVMVLVLMMVFMLVLMVVVAAALLVVFVLVVMMLVIMAAAALIVVMVVMVLGMVVAAAGALLTVIMVVVMLMLLVLAAHGIQQFIGQRHLLHGAENGLAVDLIPRGGDDGGVGVLFAQQGHGCLQLLLAQLLGTAEDDGAGGLDLVIVELTEVLHIHLHLGGVRHGGVGVEGHLGHILDGILHRHDHVAELTYAGGLDENTVRLELLINLLEGFAEVAHQGAADAARGFPLSQRSVVRSL